MLPRNVSIYLQTQTVLQPRRLLSEQRGSRKPEKKIYIHTHMYVYIYTHTYVCIYIHTHMYVYIYTHTHIHERRGAQIAGTRSLGRLNYVRWRVIFVGPQYEICFVSPFWRLELCSGSQSFVNCFHPWIGIPVEGCSVLGLAIHII
jgi:hypothetical protein